MSLAERERERELIALPQRFLVLCERNLGIRESLIPPSSWTVDQVQAEDFSTRPPQAGSRSGSCSFPIMACPRLLTTRATRAASRSLSSQRPPPSRPSPVAHTASESRFNYLPGTPTSPFDPAPPSPELASYRLVTPADLIGRQEPPKRVRMLAGDFIEDSLYNPNYGYFATKVEIFDPDRAQLKHRERERGGKAGEGEARRRKTGEKRAASEAVAPLTPVEGVVRAEGFDFTQFASTAAFEDEVAHRYMVFEGRGSREGEEGPVAGEKVGRQVWHTPTELFKVRLLFFAPFVSFLPLALLVCPSSPLLTFLSSTALVRPCPRPLPPLAIPLLPAPLRLLLLFLPPLLDLLHCHRHNRPFLPLRRPNHLRNRRWKRYPYGRHSRLPCGGSPRGLCEDKV